MTPITVRWLICGWEEERIIDRTRPQYIVVCNIGFVWKRDDCEVFLSHQLAEQ